MVVMFILDISSISRQTIETTKRTSDQANKTNKQTTFEWLEYLIICLSNLLSSCGPFAEKLHLALIQIKSIIINLRMKVEEELNLSAQTVDEIHACLGKSCSFLATSQIVEHTLDIQY